MIWSDIFNVTIAMVARQPMNTWYRAMDGTLRAVSMAQFLRNYKLLFKTFYINE